MEGSEDDSIELTSQFAGTYWYGIFLAVRTKLFGSKFNSRFLAVQRTIPLWGFSYMSVLYHGVRVTM